MKCNLLLSDHGSFTNYFINVDWMCYSKNSQTTSNTQPEAFIILSRDGVHLKSFIFKYRTSNRWTIGRKKDNDIILDSINISRIQATIRREFDTLGIRYSITDGCTEKASTNGIYYQNKRILWHFLNDGDLIALPDRYVLEFHQTLYKTLEQ